MPLHRALITIRKQTLQRRQRRRGQTTFYDLPITVVKLIFLFACTDGGRTACSLALVSKVIHAIAFPTRFHSVSLTSGLTRKLQQFIGTFEAVCRRAAQQQGSRPVVRHLCLTVSLASEERRDGVAFIYRSSRGELAICNPTVELQAIYENALKSLFRRVGTSQLESLAIIGDESWGRGGDSDLTIECPEGFPKLHSLAFTGVRKPPFIPTRLPALRRLLMAPRNEARVDFKWWARCAPGLEELQVMTKGPVQEDMMFLPSLKTLLSQRGRRDPSHDSSPWPELHRLSFGYHARLTRDRMDASPADRTAYVTRVGELSSFFATLSPGGPLVCFTPSSELKDSLVSVQELDRKDASGQNAYMRVDWELRLNGHKGLSIREFDYWRMDSRRQDRADDPSAPRDQMAIYRRLCEFTM
ncbi:hypothetical protein C8Q70DRAFT_1055263 [Cubamyces menziesii]|nr:hypothetical protein C8Q70DRAFT_1055263 [Cubamyces menziesii]